MGAGGASHVTGFLFAHKDPGFDPIVDATIPLVFRYCRWVWDRRASDSDLRVACSTAQARLRDRPHWNLVQGPVGA
eukprot:9469939-Pyramimonas_sp.AAC.1